MAKVYGLKFGSGDPRTNTGLTPTFLFFYNASSGATLPPPGITELFSGSGVYHFSYGASGPVSFLVDGGASLASSDRYVTGILDPIQAVDEKVGNLTDSFGSTATDPSSIIGYLRRAQEFLEGNATFNKSTGVWSIYTRGSSTLLQVKTLTNTTSQAGKT